MARYCFYCGRELDDYEKCDCRGRAYVAGENARHAPPEQQQEKGDTGPRPDQRAQQAQGSAWQHREETPPQRTYQTRPRYNHRRRPLNVMSLLASFFRFFAHPADSMAAELNPSWDRSHTLWFSLALALSGIHYTILNRSIALILHGTAAPLSIPNALLSWLTGSLLVAIIMLLYALCLWLISRFLYRQRALPFWHTLAVGKSAWKFLILFLALSLPSLFTRGAVYGLVLSLMGLVFAVLVHTKQLAALTSLDDNRTWQLSYLAIVLFAGIFSSVTAMVQMLNLLK